MKSAGSWPSKWLVALAAVTALVVASCTVTPRVVRNRAASFDGNAQNSGLLGFDAAGNGILTAHARDRYNGLIEVYGRLFSPPLEKDSGVVPTGTNTFLMDAQHRFYFETMNRWRHQGKPGN